MATQTYLLCNTFNFLCLFFFKTYYPEEIQGSNTLLANGARGLSKAGDHVTFVYDNIVSQQIIFAIFFDFIFQNSINLYRSCSRKINSDSNSIKLSNITQSRIFLFVFAQIGGTYFLTKNTALKSLCKHKKK